MIPPVQLKHLIYGDCSEIAGLGSGFLRHIIFQADLADQSLGAAADGPFSLIR